MAPYQLDMEWPQDDYGGNGHQIWMVAATKKVIMLDTAHCPKFICISDTGKCPIYYW